MRANLPDSDPEQLQLVSPRRPANAARAPEPAWARKSGAQIDGRGTGRAGATMVRRGGREGRHHLDREVHARDDGERAELAQPQVDEGPAQDAAVDVFDEHGLEQRVHPAEVSAHLLRDGPVDGVEGLLARFAPGLKLVNFVKMFAALRMKPNLLNFDQGIDCSRKSSQRVGLQYDLKTLPLVARR